MEKSDERGKKRKRQAGDLSRTSSGHSTGNSPPMYEEERRRKRPLVVGKYVCLECGTDSSGEWRKGPHGKKTLCNACGLKWSKEKRKLHNRNSNPSSPSGAGVSSIPTVSNMSISPEKSASKSNIQVRSTSQSAQAALEVRAKDSGPNSLRTLRSNYRDASVQTDEEKDCWYSMSPLSTPKKRFISLSKRLLIRQHKIRDGFRNNPGQTTADQKCNVESTTLTFRTQEYQSAVPAEEVSSSAQTQSGAESSKRSFRDSSQSPNRRNKPSQSKVHFWGESIGAKEPPLNALNELREKSLKEAKGDFDDPDAAVKLKASCQKLSLEEPRPDSKETESFYQILPPHKPQTHPPMFQNLGGTRNPPTGGHGVAGTDSQMSIGDQEKSPAGSKDTENPDGEDVTKRAHFMGRFQNRK